MREVDGKEAERHDPSIHGVWGPMGTNHDEQDDDGGNGRTSRHSVLGGSIRKYARNAPTYERSQTGGKHEAVDTGKVIVQQHDKCGRKRRDQQQSANDDEVAELGIASKKLPGI